MARLGSGKSAFSARGRIDLNSPESEDSVRDAISRRVLDGISALVRDVNSSNVPFDVGYRCVMVIHDIVLPFVNSDTKNTLTQVVGEWRNLARKQDENLAKQQLERKGFHERLEQVRSVDEVVF